MSLHGAATAAHQVDATVAASSAVMVCLDEPRSCTSAIDRASELALQLDAGLHVLSTIDGEDDRKARRQRCTMSDLLHEASVVLVRHPRLTGETRIGSAAATAIEAGTELCPSLVVLGDLRHAGATAVTIADALGVPVLVARPRSRSERLVVATDLRRASRPMIAAGRRYIRARGGSFTVLHVAAPAARDEASGFIPLHDVAPRTLDRAGRERIAQLRELGEEGPDLAIMIGASGDPGAAIVAYAMDTDTDVLAVGYAQRASFGSPPHHTTAEIVDQARCSILVVPLARELEND
ncbi:MAG: universal stress protein [Deltaproteobacteria bacterium]|nr:universal stress protein [Deltaproteobacteria bacterium]